jgi:hypothetical protein
LGIKEIPKAIIAFCYHYLVNRKNSQKLDKGANSYNAHVKYKNYRNMIPIYSRKILKCNIKGKTKLTQREDKGKSLLMAKRRLTVKSDYLTLEINYALIEKLS